MADSRMALFHYHLVTRCSPSSLESFKTHFETTGLVVLTVEGIQEHLGIKVGKIWKRRKKSILKMGLYCLVGSGIGRNGIFGGNACFYLCGPFIIIFV